MKVSDLCKMIEGYAGRGDSNKIVTNGIEMTVKRIRRSAKRRGMYVLEAFDQGCDRGPCIEVLARQHSSLIPSEYKIELERNGGQVDVDLDLEIGCDFVWYNPGESHEHQVTPMKREFNPHMKYVPL